MIGRTLSHYRIQEEISRGGMGVVYRAVDTKLDREVAVKILPPELVADESRRRRFVKEAKAAAAIHHPHIATIHEIDRAEGVDFIVMELIEGEKLSAVLTRERLPVSRTLALATEIVEGLSKAHEKNVVHRDLKPANIMVTREGHIKIIDFGLAKLIEPFRPLAGGGSEAETGVRGETDPGQIVGTVSYMSPEQARGQEVDPRSDIFSFGVVFYEMLSGTLPFRGKTGTDTLSAILRDPTPRLSGIESSEELQHVVNRCLAKDPEERYQTTKDLLADIRRIRRETESGVRAVAAAPSRRRALGVLVAALVLAVAGLVVLWPRAPERFSPRIGRTIQVTREPGLEIDAAVSPDGKLVAYAAGPLGAMRIYVKQVAAGRRVPLTESLTGDHRFPRWSPDGTHISFQSERPDGLETYIVPALGGAPRRFPTSGGMLGLVWSPNGEQIAHPTESAIFVGPSAGGEARKLSDAFQPSSLSWSPDGMRIAFTSGNRTYLSFLNDAPSSIWVADLSGGEPVRVTEGAHFDFSPVWTQDGKSLLVVSDRGGGRDIYRISVGPAGQPAGGPERLTTGLNVFTIASSANSRRLSYSVATSRQNIWSLSVPREGPVSVKEARALTTGNQIIEGVDISADGKWVVFDSNQSGKRSLFKMPVGGGEPVQLTTAPTMDCCPSWSPDGKEVAFHAFRTGNRDIFVVSADGGTPRQLTKDPAQEHYPHWSPDGTRVVFLSTRSGRFEIYVLSKDKGELSGETPVQLTFDGGAYPRWSPDGSLIAYESRSGVSVLPSEGGEPRALTDFGNFPMWSKDSRTIYFRVNPPDRRAGIWSVPSSGGEPKLLVRFDDSTRPPVRPEWSCDGEQFYFTLTEYEADVWVMELEDSKK